MVSILKGTANWILSEDGVSFTKMLAMLIMLQSPDMDPHVPQTTTSLSMEDSPITALQVGHLTEVSNDFTCTEVNRADVNVMLVSGTSSAAINSSSSNVMTDFYLLIFK